MDTPDRGDPLRRFRWLAVVTLVASLVLVALGGAVRATDSGLACPTWPGCFSAGDFVPALQLNVWLEHSHRLVAGAVGLAIAALLVWAIASFRDQRGVLRATVAAAVLVNVQAALGAVVVLRLLRAELVTAHLGMAMLVVACLAYLVVSAGRGMARTDAPRGDLGLARTWVLVTGLCFVQILVGGHVTGIAAGLAYTDFPLMGGAVFPEITSEREAFHAAHRFLAYALVIGVVYLCFRAVRHRREHPSAPRRSVRLPMWAAALVVIQIGIGVGNLYSGTSWLTVVPHLAVASWIWLVLVLGALHAYRDAAPAAAASGLADEPDHQLVSR
ncbi:MAG: COX15/CtaA family protein [Chloroflexi bacterium]|nr:COX15/CtaA family protein [Chloroflexota bacterium]